MRCPEKHILYWLGVVLQMFIFGQSVYPQEQDTLINTNIEFLTDQLENISQNSDQVFDFSDLVDSYLYYSTHQINLNVQAKKLVEINLINQIQLNNLNAYINNNGQLYSVYELKNIPGFDNQTIQNLLPFVTTETIVKKTSLNPRDIFKYGKHRLVLRYQQTLEESSAYRFSSDSALLYPGNLYLGSQQGIFARYSFNYNDKLRIGFVLDKDAGEVFLKSSLNDSVKALVGNKVNNIFDFFSGHIYLEDLGFIKNIVVGDYHLEFGQGLTMWSGLAFGKSAEGVQIKRFARGIRPNTSRDENRFLRGGAATLGWKRIELTGFFSSNQVDATLQTFSDQANEITSIVETGLHRTLNELLKKDALNVMVFGGRIAYNQNRFNIGATAFQTSFSSALVTDDELYKHFYFSGNTLNNCGIDFAVNLNKINLFGELSASSNGGMAGLGGLNAFFTDRFVFTLFYHDYARDYQNMYNNPVSISSAIANEKGLYFGFRALLYQSLSLSGYLDHFSFNWLRYRVNSPSMGKDYVLQLNYSPARSVSMYARYRYKSGQENYSAPYYYTDQLAEIERQEFRFFISYEPFDFLILKNRVDFVWYEEAFQGPEKGYIIYQDVLYRPKNFPLDVSFRYALFSTDSYNSRIYVYENDVLYAFTIPAYFDEGQRVYLMLRWRAIKQLDVWLRLARTNYFNRQSVGSGADEIPGSSKTEIKIQLMVKL